MSGDTPPITSVIVNLSARRVVSNFRSLSAVSRPAARGSTAPHRRRFPVEPAAELGDIFYQMYTKGTYRFPDTLTKQDHARVVLVSHNFYAHESFLWHPRAADRASRPRLLVVGG